MAEYEVTLTREVTVTIKGVRAKDEDSAQEKAGKLSESLYVDVAAGKGKKIDFEVDDDGGEWSFYEINEVWR